MGQHGLSDALQAVVQMPKVSKMALNLASSFHTDLVYIVLDIWVTAIKTNSL